MSGKKRTIRDSVTAASGRLTKKIQRQLAQVTIAPPASGPTMVAMALQAVHVPTAPPRSSGGKVVVMTASAAGVSSAPARP